MLILDLNLNGIRSAANKGFLDWLATQDADIVCVQELKAQAGRPDARDARDGRASPAASMPPKRRATAASASTPAHRRTASSKASASPSSTPRAATSQADFGKLTVVSLYLPSGSSSEERQQAKFRFLDRFRPQLEQPGASGAKSCCAATGTSPTARST
jgi:exodeoxyribonuclease-3